MDVICVRTQISLIMILAFQRWIICAHKQVPLDIDAFCVRMQIFLKRFRSSNARLFAHMSKYLKTWMYSAYVYADTPKMFFDLQTLDYLHVSI